MDLINIYVLIESYAGLKVINTKLNGPYIILIHNKLRSSYVWWTFVQDKRFKLFTYLRRCSI